MFKNIHWLYFFCFSSFIFSCGKISFSVDSSTDSSKIEISGSFTLNGGAALSIEAGQSKDIAVDVSKIKPVEAAASTFTFTGKDGETLPTGVTVTYQEATKKIRIATTADSVKAKAIYTIVATVNKDNKKYKGSVEGTMTLTVTVKPTLAITIGADALTGSGANLALKTEYGVSTKTGKGSGNFPALSWTGVSDAIDFLVLIYQDEKSGSKNFGHGIWIISKTTTSLPKKIGTIKATFGGILGDHPKLDTGVGNNKVLQTVETYFSAVPSNDEHSYKFYLFGIENLTQDQIKTQLEKVKRTSDYNPLTRGGGTAPAGIEDRAAKVKELLGSVNIVQEATSKTVKFTR